MEAQRGDHRGSAREVLRLFTRLGFTGFGGPAAHVAMMREEVVHRRRWIDDREFLDLVGACNLVPGPNSTELAIHIGLRRAGWRGFVAAAAGFILPAVGIVLTIAWLYHRYGTTPTALELSYGILPVIVAIVAHAVVGLARTAVRDVHLAVVAVGSMVGWLLGVNELILMLAAAAVVAMPWQRAAMFGLLPVAAGAAAGEPTWWRLGLGFLKIGAVLYGSGYVLVGFIDRDLVRSLHWLTERQLLDAVAIGQVTPGPVFTTATFVGYQVMGFPGAAVATVAIFAPAFVFVALLGRIVPLIRRHPVAGRALDGVVAASLGLMAGALVVIARTALHDGITWALGAVALAVLLWKRPNSVWLVAAGATVGLVHGVLT